MSRPATDEPTLVQRADPSALAGTGSAGAALAGVAGSAGPFNAVLNQCARDRDLGSALQCVGAMKEAGIELDLLSHVELIKVSSLPSTRQGLGYPPSPTTFGRSFVP